MKILILDSIGSVAYYDYSLCESLKQNDCDVELLTCQYKVDSEFNHSKINCKYVFFRLSNRIKPKDNTKWYYKVFQICKGLEYIFDSILLVRYVLDQRPDIVHIQWLEVPKFDILWIKYLKKRGVKFILTVHNILPHEEKKKHRFIYQTVYELFNKLIVHSYSDRNLLNTVFGIETSKIVVIPIGNCDLYITKNNLDKAEARHFLKINADLQIVLFFGLIRPYKGLDCLIEAWKTVTTANSLAHLLVVGKKLMPLKNIERKIFQNNMESSITFFDNYIPFNQVQYYFKAADVAVFPYVKTYNSGVLQLAYSFSLPVIVTNTGGMSEVVDNNASGVLVEPQNADSLANGIVELLSNKEKLDKMGCYAKQISSTRYSWQEIAVLTMGVYKSFLEH